MTDDLIKDRLLALTPEYRSFIESAFTSAAAVSFGAVRGFTERQMEILENALTMYLLFFLSGAELVEFVSQNCSISTAEAQELVLAIQATLPVGMVTSIVHNYTLFNGAAAIPNIPLATEIAETEQAFAALQGIRTMASDIHSLQVPDEPVYRTPSQSEILSRSANTPQTEGGRWETER